MGGGHLRYQLAQVGRRCTHSRAHRARTVTGRQEQLPLGCAHRVCATGTQRPSGCARQARNARRTVSASCARVSRDPRSDLRTAGGCAVRDWRATAGCDAHGGLRWWRGGLRPGNYYYYFFEKSRFYSIQAEVGVFTDPSQGSDTTIWRSGGSGCCSQGAAEELKIWSPGTAPGSDQFHEEIGTSTVVQLRPPNPVHDRSLNSFAGLH
ncbi:hypothetical protein F511_13419 [Dorcoceras hygrometricum]|uniref:Uncharacterized protein n=1 Tax=Dorcoceras hygrometricum TaxID=472368 RepID=A0A2Z7BQZ8_9LAMI|nr:hypothetical protein F511_13419 [Dorcoceras hygrometricum]